VAIDNFAVYRCNDVAGLVGDDNSLPSHRRSLICGRTRLHDLLQVGREVNDWTCGCELCLISVDLELHIVIVVVVTVIASTGSLTSSRRPLHLCLLVQVALHNLLGLRGFLLLNVQLNWFVGRVDSWLSCG